MKRPRAAGGRGSGGGSRHRRRLAGAALLCIAAALPADAAPIPHLSGAPDTISLLSRVDPFMGTGGHGHVYPGPSAPFGMVQPGPDNGRGGWDWTSGYHWSDSVIVGFTHTHLSGTGIGDLRDVLVLPVAGRVDLAASWEERSARPHSTFSHDRETAEPGYYAVMLDDSGIVVELTATERVALHRYHFPEDAEPGIVVDLGFAANWDRPTETGLRLHGDTLVTGHRFSTGWADDQRVFFAMEASRPFAEVELADGTERLSAGATEARGREVRAWVRFGPRVRDGGGDEAADPGEAEIASMALAEDMGLVGNAVVLRVALSYVDEEGAIRNLAASRTEQATEAVRSGFDAVRLRTRDAWEAELSKIRLRGGTPGQRRIFHTSLYRTRLCPVLFEDADGRYRGADGRIHVADGYTKHAIFSLWDTFRAAHPLYTLVDPERTGDMVASMLSFYREGGLLPVWSLVGNETNTMTGHHAVPVVVDAWLKGLGGVQAEEALEAVLASAMADRRGLNAYRRFGYIPSELEVESVTKTLEYAFDDYAVWRLAEAMGREDVAARFRERAGWWRNVYDPSTGFMRGRRAGGAWVEPFDPRRSSHREDTDYTEGNAWQHTWFVPHDVAGLMEAMGGEEAFVAKLDSLFELDSVITGENVSADISGLIGQYAHGNEPSHHIAYLYSWAGRPHRTAERVREILRTQYAAAPDGLAGNEDCGQMSAWYVFSALGFYPVDPAGGVYVIGSPLFDVATLDVGGGRRFVVRAEGTSEKNLYVQSARLDGRPLDRSWIGHDEIVSGGELVLEMGPEPSGWATSAEARPPSMSAAPAASPPDWTVPAWATSPHQEAPPRPVRSAPDHGPPGRGALSADTATARRVVEAFRHAWEGYRRHAWGHDELRPLSRGFRDWHDVSLLMTPVDAYDTMLLMGLTEEAAEAKRLIFEQLSFDHDMAVQVFEITIRLLGGLLSAYQMDGDPRFLELAADLGNRLLPAFDSPTGMPYVNVNLRTGQPSGRINNPAEVGTLMLEMGTLSKLTGDPRFYDAAKSGMIALFRRRSGIGLVGTGIDVETGEWTDPASHVSGRIDSWYEYLLKGWLLFGDPDLRAMWQASVGPLHEHLADERFRGLWYGHAHMRTGERTATRFGALDAFLPAVLALSGDLDRARRLMNSVERMWSLHGVEPEQIDYSTMEVVWPGYPLRPEAIESAYYLYRLTGDERWRDMGRTFFDAVLRATRTDAGFAHLESVVTGERSDAMQSFFLAETLKYAWLLFAPPDALDFDAVIFNTEAHPLRRTW